MLVDSTTAVAVPNSKEYNRQPNPAHARISVQSAVFRASVKGALTSHLEGIVPVGEWELLGQSESAKSFVVEFKG
eukprot:12359846-Karenia_brevis.AAC.1